MWNILFLDFHEIYAQISCEGLMGKSEKQQLGSLRDVIFVFENASKMNAFEKHIYKMKLLSEQEKVENFGENSLEWIFS